MKKLCAVFCSVICLFFTAASCALTASLDIPKASMIELQNRGDNVSAKILFSEDIRYITDNLNSLKLIKQQSIEDYGGWNYRLRWYDDNGNLLDTVVIISGSLIVYNEHFYSVSGGSTDLSFLDELLLMHGESS